MWLIEKGYADNLVVPYHLKWLKRNRTGMVDETPGFMKYASYETYKCRLIRCDSVYAKKIENTHLEIIVAKDIMENADLNSAIFVSHPYHMRRLKLIASTVFHEAKYDLRYVPTHYATVSKYFWYLNKSEAIWVIKEYAKIIWFMIYEYIPGFSKN